MRTLARWFGPDRPVYGLQMSGLGGVGRPPLSIDAAAASHLQHLRNVQPHGPYQLAGNCFGGWVAIEMARQLHAAGEPVAALLLINSDLPAGCGAAPTPRPLIERLRGKTVRQWLQAAKLHLTEGAPERALWMAWQLGPLRRGPLAAWTHRLPGGDADMPALSPGPSPGSGHAAGNERSTARRRRTPCLVGVVRGRGLRDDRPRGHEHRPVLDAAGARRRRVHRGAAAAIAWRDRTFISFRGTFMFNVEWHTDVPVGAPRRARGLTQAVWSSVVKVSEGMLSKPSAWAARWFPPGHKRYFQIALCRRQAD